MVALRFVHDALRPARWLNDRMQEVGIPVVGAFLFLAIARVWGGRWAAVVLVSYACLLLLVEGVRLRSRLDGGARFGVLERPETEHLLYHGAGILGDLIRFRFTNNGRRARFTARANWMTEDGKDFGYSPWTVQWAPEGETEIEVGTNDNGYLVPLLMEGGPDNSHLISARMKAESFEPQKFKNIRDDKPKIRITVSRVDPDATSDALIGFDTSNPPKAVVLQQLAPRRQGTIS